MFSKQLTWSVALAAALTFATAAFAQSPPGGGMRGPRPAKSDKPATEALTGADIWDANHDGVYSCDEWKSYLERLFNLADRNHDGKLDASEFAAIRKPGSLFADADFGYFDENRDGTIARSEFVNKPNEMILQHDKNRDCKVTPDELKAGGADDNTMTGRSKRP